MPYLDPYTGEWTHQQARHLLRRTTFGPSQAMVEAAVSLGLGGTLAQLFTVQPMPDPPVKSVPDGTGNNQLNDPDALYGETWVNGTPFPNISPPMLRNRVLRARSKSLYAWTFLQKHYAGISLREKLFLFWHNHFVVVDGVIAPREYVYQNLLRSHALGNFKQLTKDITIDTGMLQYLSGTENTSTAPNENYSRELLELFTVGKGPLIGPGDYTNYTEQDVEEMAKVLTGWTVPPVSNPATLTAVFNPNRHSTGDKQLSYHFGNAVIAENGANEYIDLIDVIFQQDECSRFIMRKLYRWFVGASITPEVEQEVIQPLAAIMRQNDHDIIPALDVLFRSEHFFDSVACMVKSPVDLILSASRALGVEPPSANVEDEYDHAYTLYAMCHDLAQGLYDLPNVAGWSAYYQAPQYDRTWINNLLLPKRHAYCRLLVEGGVVSIDGENYQVPNTVPVLALAASIPDATDPNVLITELAARLFNYPITAGQLTALKDVLIPGLPDFEWTAEYVYHLDFPSDLGVQQSVSNKLRSLLSVMVRMSEFQIM
ncbi:MAG: DUF1800 domain-containing protein [Flavobacteriales bacterium]|jgi:hypothetical protein|nr:DUF1800 domain-containing protein [Flavobacteriales bacterium]